MHRSAHPTEDDVRRSAPRELGERRQAAGDRRHAGRRFERALRQHGHRCDEADAEIRAFLRGA